MRHNQGERVDWVTECFGVARFGLVGLQDQVLLRLLECLQYYTGQHPAHYTLDHAP